MLGILTYLVERTQSGIVDNIDSGQDLDLPPASTPLRQVLRQLQQRRLRLQDGLVHVVDRATVGGDEGADEAGPLSLQLLAGVPGVPHLGLRGPTLLVVDLALQFVGQLQPVLKQYKH